MKKTFTTVVVALILASGSSIALADSSDVPLRFVPSVRHIIVKAAIAYNTNPESLIMVAKCESGLSMNPSGSNDHGKAHGLFQFHQPTFDTYSQKAGISDPDISNINQQAQVAAYMFKNGQKSQWTCSKKVGLI